MGRSKGQLEYEAVNKYNTLVDYSSGTNPIYVGKSEAGVATSAARWQIFKITWDSNNNPTAVKFPDQNLPTDDAGISVNANDFKFIWTSRATYFA